MGANNVGKSRALKDLREDLNNISKSKVIIKNVAYEATGFSGDKLRDYFERNIAKLSLPKPFEILFGRIEHTLAQA